MDSILHIAENTLPENEKKEWVKPAFEIISKDAIKGGAVSGAEGTAYHS